MNDNLLISIGADTSSFTAALSTAEKEFKKYRKTINNLGKDTQLVQSVADFAKQINLNEKKYKAFSNKIKNINKEATDAQIKEAFAYYGKLQQLAAAEEAKKKSAATALRNKEATIRRELYELGISFTKKMGIAELNKVRKTALAQRKALADAKSYEERKQQVLYKRKLSLIRREESAHKEMIAEAYAYNERREQLLYKRKLANIRRVEARNKKESDGTATWDFAGHRGLIDSTKVVAKYGAISQALYGMQNAYRAVGAEIIRFNQSVYDNMAVLGATREQAVILSESASILSQAYGGSVADISEAMLVLGRAGIDLDKGIGPLQQSTKVLAELAMITGDTMAEGAAGIATMLSVYPELTTEVEKLGNQMAIVANATRLGLKDFTTISNYALTTASSIGLSSEAYLALAGSMSKVGLNASTIGTSIRRLKKFTDSTSESMKLFFRYLGVEQSTFREMLQNTETSTSALIAFSRQLAKISKDKQKYTEMTKRLNIQEKATIDALRLIGESDYLARMVISLKKATKGSKELEEQAKRMAQGLRIAFERTGNIISQTFNGLGETISGLLFDSSSVESFTEDINDLAKTVVFLIKQLPILGIAWVAYAVKMSIVNAAKEKSVTITSLLTTKIKNLSKTLLDFGKANWVILGITAAFTIWNVIATKSKKIQEDLNALIAGGAEKLKEFGENALIVTERDTKKIIKEIKEEIAAKKALLSQQEKFVNVPDVGLFIDTNYQLEYVQNMRKELEEMNKHLKEMETVLSKVRKEQNKFSDTPSPYVLTPEDLANQKETAILSAQYNTETTSALLSYTKLVAKRDAAVLLAKKESDLITNVAQSRDKLIAAETKAQKAKNNLLSAEKKIQLDLINSKIQLNNTEGKLSEYRLKTLNSTVTLKTLEKEKVLLGEKLGKQTQAMSTMLLTQGAEYKKTTEYAILKTEANKTAAKVAENTLATLKEQNKQLGITVTLLNKAQAASIQLNTLFQNFVYSAESSARAIGVMLGTMTSGQANVANQNQLLTNAEKSAKLAQEDVTLKKKSLELVKANTSATTAQINQAESALNTAQQTAITTQQAVHAQTVTTFSARQQNALDDIAHQKEIAIVAAKRANIDLNGLSAKERAVRETAQESKLLSINLDYAKKAYAVGKSRELGLGVKQAELAIEQQKEKIIQKQWDLDNKKTGSSAVTIASHELDIEMAKLQVSQARLANDEARQGLVASNYVLEERKTELFTAQAVLAKDTYDNAVLKYGLNNKDLRIRKKILGLELKSIKADTKAWKQKNKGLTKFQKSMQKIGSSFADSLLTGDIKGAFEGLLDDILDVFIKPLKDSFSEVFGKNMQDMFGETFTSLQTAIAEATNTVIAEGDKATESSTANSAKEGAAAAGPAVAKAGSSSGWVGAIAMMGLMAALGLLKSSTSSTISEADTRAAEGFNEVGSESAIEALEVIKKNGTLGLVHSASMVTSLSELVSLSDKAASGLTEDILQNDYLSSTDYGFFNDEARELTASGIKIDSASLESLKNTFLSGTNYMIEKVTDSGFWGIGAGESYDTTLLGAADEKVMSAITDAYLAGADAIKEAAKTLGVSAIDIDNISAQWVTSVNELNFAGKSQEEAAELINSVISTDMDKWAGTIAPLAGYIEQFKKAGEGNAETLIRLANDYEYVGSVMRDLGQTLPDVADGGLAAAEALIDAAGSLEEFADAMGSFIDYFYTDGEKLVMLESKLKLNLGAVGLQLPETAAGFRLMVEGLMLSTVASARKAETLLAEAKAAELADESTVEFINELYRLAGEAKVLADQDADRLKAVYDNMDDNIAYYEALENAANDAKDALEEIAQVLMGIAQLKAEWMGDEAGARLILNATIRDTELTGINYDNFLEEFTKVANENMTTEELSAWSDLSSALKDLYDINVQQLEEEVDFYGGVLSKIEDAYLGSLSYLNSEEKADYSKQIADMYLANGDTQSYIDFLGKQLEYEKKISVTKEDYAENFDGYIKELQKQEPEATTDDVVERLDSLISHIESLEETIEHSA